MDTLQEDIVHPSPMRPQTEACLDPEPPILAEVEGSLIKNQYAICTSSPQFENGNLGTVKISTHYIMCRPKKFDINLFTVRKGKYDSSEEEVIVLQSKEPDWNHRSQIFELDFGGRDTEDIGPFSPQTMKDHYMDSQFDKNIMYVRRPPVSIWTCYASHVETTLLVALMPILSLIQC